MAPTSGEFHFNERYYEQRPVNENWGELPLSTLNRIKDNKPQNFDQGRKRANLRPSEVLCSNGCGDVLQVGIASQINHNRICSKNLVYEQQIANLKSANVLSQPAKQGYIGIDEELCSQLEDDSRTHLVFEYGRGSYKTSKNDRKRDFYLLAKDVVIEQKGKSRRRKH